LIDILYYILYDCIRFFPRPSSAGIERCDKEGDMNRRTMLATTLSLAAVLCGTPRAEAADRFGVIGVENATHVTIRLNHRWGNAQWGSDVLTPNEKKWYWWTFSHANEDKTPQFQVRFDSDLSPGTFYEKYDLQAYQAPAHEWDNAHKYIFRYDGNKKFIELYDEKK
jgi:hypothetical protein